MQHYIYYDYDTRTCVLRRTPRILLNTMRRFGSMSQFYYGGTISVTEFEKIKNENFFAKKHTFDSIVTNFKLVKNLPPVNSNPF